MFILSIDTSSKSDSCSIVTLSGELIANISSEIPSVQSENIIDLIDFAVQSSRIDKREIYKIGVCKGPGSFTGARVGMAAALGMSISLKADVFAIDKFDITEFETGKKPFFKRGNKNLIKERGKLVEAKGIGEDWIEIGALSLTNSIVIARMLVNNDKKYRDLSILY